MRICSYGLGPVVIDAKSTPLIRQKMSWTKRELKRSYPCNGKLLKQLRQQAGLSQRKLAKQSGYCDRLISKAEAGGSVAISTLEVLAQTLSTKARVVFVEELTTDPIAIAKSFTHALYKHRDNFIERISHLVTEDAVFHIAGNPSKDRYAGVHYGIKGFKFAMDEYFRVMEVSANVDYSQWYEYFAVNDDVVVWGQSWFHPKGAPHKAPVAITQRLKFRDGKIFSFEERFVAPVARGFENSFRKTRSSCSFGQREMVVVSQ